MKSKYVSGKNVVLAVLCMTMCAAACGRNGEGAAPTGTMEATATPLPTVTLAPEPSTALAEQDNWIVQFVRQGRTELSTDWSNGLKEEGFYAEPVEITKTVHLGEFEYTMSVPKAIFKLENLKNGTDVIETTTTLRYVGEKEKVTIVSRESPFYAGEIADLHGNSDGGGSADVEAQHVLVKGEELSFTKAYDAYSKRVIGAGPGVIMALVEFTVLDENEMRTEEHYNYLLSIPYDVTE